MPFTPWAPTIGNIVPPLPASQGGTGQTSLPLTVANGGTGATSVATALAGLGIFQTWLPADDGFLGANSDPSAASGGGLLVAGTLYLARLNVRVATTITNLFYGVSVIGVGASTGSFAGLYSAAGALLSGSADIAANLTGTLPAGSPPR